MNRDHSVFEIASKYCISDSFIDYEGYSISSKGFLPTVVDIVVTELNSPIPVHFSSLIPKMLMFTLAISCLITSNLSCFIPSAPNIPSSYAILFFTAFDFTSITSHIYNWVFCFGSLSSFFMQLYLHWSPVAYWHLPTWGVHLSVSYLFVFYIVMGFSRQEYWSGLPFPSPGDYILSELSILTLPSWVALHGMTHSFIELDKAVVHVISLVRFLWLWFSLCWPSDG